MNIRTPFRRSTNRDRHKRRSAAGRSRRAASRCLRLEQLEARVLLDADIVISELFASNVKGLIDFQGKKTPTGSRSQSRHGPGRPEWLVCD